MAEVFINPIEILGLAEMPVLEINPALVKKQRRRLQSELELADEGAGLDNYGTSVSKNDILNACEKLEDAKNIEIFHYIANHPSLNEFLATAEPTEFFSQLSDDPQWRQRDAIFKNTDFIQLIAPQFAKQINRVIYDFFLQNNRTQLILACSEKRLLRRQDFGVAYNKLEKEIERRTEICDELFDEIKNADDDDWDDIIEKLAEVKADDFFLPQLLNILPDYFALKVKNFAKEYNSIGAALFNQNKEYATCEIILTKILQLEIWSAEEQKSFKQNLKVVREGIEAEKHKPILEKWAGIIAKLVETNKDLEKSQTTPHYAYQKITKLVNIDELNALPGFADEIRKMAAALLRALAFSCLEKFQNLQYTTHFINLALKINLKDWSSPRI